MAGHNPIFFVELTIFEGAAVAWAAWELWQIRPGKKEKPKGDSSPQPTSPEDPGHAERQHGPDDG